MKKTTIYNTKENHPYSYEYIMLRIIYESLGNWRAVSDKLGMSPAYWNKLATGVQNFTAAKANRLRRFFGYAPHGKTKLSQFTNKELKWYMRNLQEV